MPLMQQATIAARSVSTRSLSPRQTMWGHDIHGLHDLAWSAQGVVIVRPGQAPPRRARGVYLLLDRCELLVCERPAAITSCLRSSSRLCRLDLVETGTNAYAESLETDEDDRVVGIRRSYEAQSVSLGHVLVTSSWSHASAWAAGSSRDAGVDAVMRDIRVRHYGRQTIHARRWNASGFSEAKRILPDLLHFASRSPAVFDLIRRDDIVMHRQARCGDAVRCVGPLWIGADVSLTGTTPIIGPSVIMDGAVIDDAGAPSSAILDVAMPRPTRTGMYVRPRRFGRGKRVFDIVFSLGALAVTLPLYPVIMLLIALEDGRPFFFAHTRQTRGGASFRCLKFRTMCRDAEARKAALTTSNDADGPQFFMQDDPRVLRIGRWLRRLHIDEWPQFWNILVGHMSVVGPRPSPDVENQYCPAWREARLSVRPGLTGLWQVKRTREPLTDFQEWIRYDLAYIQRRTWRLDLWIIARTIRIVVS